MLPDNETLERLLSDVESDRIERKESLSGDAPGKIREAICAFANDLPNSRTPGIVFVGARDNGEPTGLVVTDELLLNLASMKTDGNILPPPSIVVQKRTLKGKEMAVVAVLPSDTPPVRCKGRIWIRIGPRRGLATAQDERILNEKRRHADLPFDAQPVPSSTIWDLSQRMFESEYLPQSVAPDVPAANDRTFLQRLAAAKMITSVDEPVPTVLAHLVIGIRARDYIPGAYVQFLRIGGSEISDEVMDELVIDGSTAETIARTEDKLKAHNRQSVDFTSDRLETRKAKYPAVALEQLFRNAIMHRSHEATNSPVRITWYDESIEIFSPGGPYGVVTAQNFGQPGFTDYRNPNLAEAMKVLGFVQKFGAGIATARRAIAANGNPPIELEVSASAVIWKLRARP